MLIFICVFVKYVDQIVLSQTLAKNLSHVCTKKLTTLYSAAEQMQSEQPTQAPQSTAGGKTTTTTIGIGGLGTANTSTVPTSER